MSSFDSQQDKTASLTASERSLAFKLAENPMELFQGKTVGWLEDFIRITVGTGGRQEGTGENVTGHFAWIAKDLSLQTVEYVYEDDSGRYLYTNGVYVSTITYVDLYEYFGPNCYGPDIGDTFKLPDSRGRAAFFCGTHANTGLGDNDGIALSSRQVFHQHNVSTTVSITGSAASASGGTPTGTISASFTGSALGTHTHTDSGHTHPPPSGQLDYWGGDPAPGGEQFQGGGTYKSHNGGATGSGSANISSNSAGTPAGSVSATFSGSALAGHTHTVTGTGTGTGTAGTGMSSDGPAHIYIGSLVVRF